jgi:hypothetical protein
MANPVLAAAQNNNTALTAAEIQPAVKPSRRKPVAAPKQSAASPENETVSMGAARKAAAAGILGDTGSDFDRSVVWDR